MPLCSVRGCCVPKTHFGALHNTSCSVEGEAKIIVCRHNEDQPPWKARSWVCWQQKFMFYETNFTFFYRVKFWQKEWLHSCTAEQVHATEAPSQIRTVIATGGNIFTKPAWAAFILNQKCSLHLSQSVSLFTGKMNKKAHSCRVAGISGGSCLAFSIA